MTLTEFILKWQGKYIDFDGVYPNQCMDLMHQYIYDCLGLTDARILASPCARDTYVKFDDLYGNGYFEQINNTPIGVPQEGDLVFFSNGEYGHVCIFFTGDTNKFKSFDANWPTGSLPHIQEHNYRYCLGWLRFKNNVPAMVEVENKVFESLVRKSTICDKVEQKLQVGDSETVVLAEIEKLLGYEDAIVQKDTLLTEAQEKISQLEKQSEDKAEELEKLTKELEVLTDKVKKATTENETLSEELKILKEQYQPKPVFTGIRKFLYDLISKY
jgi:hypothetical protein